MIDHHARPRTLHEAETIAAEAERRASQMRLAKRKEEADRLKHEMEAADFQRFVDSRRRRERQLAELAEQGEFLANLRLREELAAHAVTTAREDARLDARLADARWKMWRAGLREFPE